jgi:hypothetical protein
MSLINEVNSSPVNSGVIHAWKLRHATGKKILPSSMAQPRGGLTTHSTRPRDSLSFIVGLFHNVEGFMRGAG